MERKRERICGATLFVLGILALAAGIIVLLLLPSIVRNRVNSDVALTEGSFAERAWRDPPFDIVMQFWIFNVTNADDIVERGSTPKLEQKGPYGFVEKQFKEDVEFSANNTVSYFNRKEYFWSPALSCETCSLSDKFIIPNIPYVILKKMLREVVGKLPWYMQPIIDKILQGLFSSIGEHPFVSDHTAAELLFDGYKDRIFHFINNTLAIYVPSLKGSVPDRVGLFYGRNATYDGLYVVRTGADDVRSVGRVVEWENHTDLYWTEWWRSGFSQANMINGSDGTVYHPFIERTDTLQMFIHDVCRSLHATYESDVQFRGVTAYRFTAPPDVFDSNITANRGFCWPSKEQYYSESVQPKEKDGWCLPSGMLDISKCQHEVPIVVTAPQFTSCPEEVRQSVSGLYNESEEFATYLDLEPQTGVVLSGARKVQLNVAMYADGSGGYKNMKPVIMPVLWLNESVVIDDNTWSYIYKQVVVNQRVAYIRCYVAVTVGSVSLLSSFLLAGYMFARSRGLWPAQRDSEEFLRGDTST